MPAWADPEAFEVRASPAFVGREAFCQTTGVNLGAFAYAREGNATISEGSYASLANAEFDPTAEDAPESYTFTCNGWTATVSLATMVQRRDSHVVALSFSPPAGQNNPTLDLLVADAYATHALALVQIVNGTPVATALSVGEKFWVNPSLSFTRATVPFDPTLTFRVIDGNTGARGPFGSTMVADAWIDGPGDDAFRTVTFYLDASESGLRYTLHSQASGPEILRSLVAVQGSEAQQGQQTIGDFTTEDETGAVCITGFVPIGGYYWVTRDLDGACIESRMLDPNLSYPTPLQWSLRGQHALPPPMQVITLHVAATNGSALSIHQDSAERSVTLADETVYVIEDYDAWGNPHPFYYRNFTATVNMRETWWLMQGSTQLNAGDIWLYDGWSPIGGVAQDRQAVTFGIASGFGAHAWVTDTSGTGGLTLAGANQRIDDYNEDGSPNHFYYDLWSATVDVSRPFYLNIGDGAGNLVAQMPANELWFKNNWQAIGGMPVNNQLVTFVVPHGVEQLWVWQAGTTDLTFKVRGHIEDYFNDDEGAPNFFEYDEYTASVDVNRPYYLMVDGVTLADHETTWYGSWVRQGGVKPHHFTLSLTLHGSRAAHNFSIREPDGTLWNWAPTGTTEPATLALPDAWDASGTQPPWALDTEILITEWRHRYSGQNGTWTISDDTTGQSQHFNPGTAAAYTLNLGAWFTAATGFPVTVSLSRWSHTLRIMDRAGGLYSVDPIASQGSSTTFGFEGAWYESYYYFDATAHRVLVPGLEWRLYDATAKEFAPFDPGNPADYTNWHYTPAPAHVTGTQTSLTTLDLTWDFPVPPGSSPAGDSTELLAGSFTVRRLKPATQEWVIVQDGLASSFQQSPATAPLAFHHTEAAMPPGTYTYRLFYRYGGQDSATVERSFTVLPAVTYYGLTPVNLTATQVKLDGLKLTWNLPAAPDIDLQQGTFTFVRTALHGTGPVTFTKSAASQSYYALDGTLSCFLSDDPLALDDYTYTVRYTYAGVQSAPATVSHSVLDADTLETRDDNHNGVKDLDDVLSAMGYSPLFVTAPSPLIVKAGGSRTFTVFASGGVGARTISVAPAQSLQYGSIAIVSRSQSSITLTYTGNGNTVGGLDYIYFTVSDAFRTRSLGAPAEVTPSSSATLKALNAEFVIQASTQSFSDTLPVLGGSGSLTFSVSDPDYGTVTLDDPATGEFTYEPGSANGGQFDFTVTDDITGDSSTATIYIAVVDQPPPSPSIAFEELSPSSGFSPPWLMVPQGGANWVSLNSTASTDDNARLWVYPSPSLETVSPGSTSDSPQTITVTGTHLGDSSTVIAQMGSDPMKNTSLNISVKRYRIKNVVIHKVKQVYFNNLLKTSIEPTKVPAPADLQNYLNDVFGRQTNTWFNVTQGQDISVDYDIENDGNAYPGAFEDGRLDVYGTFAVFPQKTKEQGALEAYKTVGAIDVFYVNSLTVWFNRAALPYVKNDTYGAATRPDMSTVYMSDAAANTLHDTAHEIGHQLLRRPNHESEVERLMYDTTGAGFTGTLLKKEEWDIINPNTP